MQYSHEHKNNLLKIGFKLFTAKTAVGNDCSDQWIIILTLTSHQ